MKFKIYYEMQAEMLSWLTILIAGFFSVQFGWIVGVLPVIIITVSWLSVWMMYGKWCKIEILILCALSLLIYPVLLSIRIVYTVGPYTSYDSMFVSVLLASILSSELLRYRAKNEVYNSTPKSAVVAYNKCYKVNCGINIILGILICMVYCSNTPWDKDHYCAAILCIAIRYSVMNKCFKDIIHSGIRDKIFC